MREYLVVKESLKARADSFCDLVLVSAFQVEFYYRKWKAGKSLNGGPKGSAKEYAINAAQSNRRDDA